MTDFVLPTTPTEINLFSERESVLQDLTNAIVITRRNGQVSCNTAEGYSVGESEEILAWLPALLPENFGDPIFKSTYGVKYAYYAGAMAKGIASTDMVIALGKAGFFGSFGAAGVSSRQLEAAIHSIQAALPNGPYAFNLLSSPNEEALEQHIVDMYLKHGVHVVEAAAYMEITAPLVLFRCSGLSLLPDGEIKFSNRIIAKVSRMEVAEKFMQPAPEKIISRLVEDGRISRQQADLARCVPVADDITVEADSGGHTDNRPLVCLLPSMLRLRDEIQAHYAYAAPVRVGAAGGISNPTAALAAYMMGAAYIVTGSINQACVESGTSHHTKKLLAQAAMTNVAMAPSADMFEQGVRVQVLKLGTLYPMRAQKLYDFYSRYDSIDQIPSNELEKLNRQIFQRSIESIWEDIVRYFNEHDPTQIERAENNPKHKMALVFRWYLGLSSLWSISSEKGREMDYQIWCGPSMGSFNDWVRGTYLEQPENRHVGDVAGQLLTGAAYLHRMQILKLLGFPILDDLMKYTPTAPLYETR